MHSCQKLPARKITREELQRGGGRLENRSKRTGPVYALYFLVKMNFLLFPFPSARKFHIFPFSSSIESSIISFKRPSPKSSNADVRVPSSFTWVIPMVQRLTPLSSSRFSGSSSTTRAIPLFVISSALMTSLSSSDSSEPSLVCLVGNPISPRHDHT